MNTRLCAASAALILSACSREAPQEAPPASALQSFVERIGSENACARVIPQEWSPSLPVPVLDGRSLRYRVFFRGWEGRSDAGIQVRDAEGDALFGIDGKVLECRQHAERGRLMPDAKLPTATREEFESRERALYGKIEEMGRLYARGTPLSDAERAEVKAFAVEFAFLTNPGHAQAYRNLSPDFWAWVDKNGGSAPSPR